MDDGCLDASASGGLPALTGNAAKSANLLCLGRLPWKTLGLSIDGVDEFDATGIAAWYGVSANLADPNSCLQYLNPATVSQTPISFVCPSLIAPPFPWLKVCDQTGKLLSDRVAFVVIVPGAAIATEGRTQTRVGAPRPQAQDFLDAIPVPSGWSALPPAQRCATYDNAALTNEFVSADTSVNFNDRLAYVTIDELMESVEQRVAQEARESLIRYQSKHGRYPWMVSLANPAYAPATYTAANGALSGLFPFHTTTAATTQKFLTELSWSIPTTAVSDSVVPGTSSSPNFLCFGGAYQCRLRTTANAAIPRSITTAEFAALKSPAVPPISAPLVSCAHAGENTIKCDSYSYAQAQATTYNLQRRIAGSGDPYVFYGTYTGMRNRTITIFMDDVTASSSSVFNVDANFFVRKTVTSSPRSTIGMLSVVDTWVPSSPGVSPFDVSSGPFQTGSASTNGTVSVVASLVRVYPEMPNWYFTEKWNEFVLSAVSSDASPATGGSNCATNCFTAGARTGLQSIVVSVGAPLAGQNRYVVSPAAADFVEGANATGIITLMFADPKQTRSGTYADTIATIPR